MAIRVSTKHRMGSRKRKNSHKSNSVEDVDEGSQNLSVEVRRDEGAERGEEGDDGHAHGQVVPAVELRTAGHHELPPEEPWNCIKTLINVPRLMLSEYGPWL